MAKKIPVGILGATGSVGQRFIQLLEGHPFFEVTELAASDQSAGKPYAEAVAGRWKLSAGIPNYAKNLVVEPCRPLLGCKVVFSGLDSSVAGEIEYEFADAGYVVISNSKNHRMDGYVPLLSAEVNPEHLEMLKFQKTKGKIVTNSNCTIMGVTIALKALERFGVQQVMLFSMQALSGAGYPGVPSMDIVDNVIPFINGEEHKAETEPLKMLGTLKNGKVDFANIKISAQCSRVAVSDGHTVCLSIKFKKKPGLEELKMALSSFRGEPQRLKLPLAPDPLIIVREEEDRPQPRLDRNEGKGMAVVVGRIRPCAIFDYKMAVLSHNTIRGAAGAAILNAELMFKKGYFG